MGSYAIPKRMMCYFQLVSCSFIVYNSRAGHGTFTQIEAEGVS